MGRFLPSACLLEPFMLPLELLGSSFSFVITSSFTPLSGKLLGSHSLILVIVFPSYNSYWPNVELLLKFP